jgi:4-hydroxybenzoate polyprenyltransferase
MYLNDAFDRDFDRNFRPERPIPIGQVGAAAVFSAGFGMLAGGIAVLAIAAGGEPWALASGSALAGVIVLYDAWHKHNPISPLLMGVCRMLAYVAAGAAVTGAAPVGLWIAAGASLCYLIGLTYAAKQERLLQLGSIWPLAFLAMPVAYGLATTPTWPLAVVLALLVLWVARAVMLLLRGGSAIPQAVVARCRIHRGARCGVRCCALCYGLRSYIVVAALYLRNLIMI